MKNLRTYGKAPFNVAVIHGGPGAGGEMAPIARELASGWGVLEPLQTEASLEGQVEELKTVLEKNGDLPVTLIGFSWGAWLSYILAAGYPAIVKKLILIGSGVYEEKYAADIMNVRLSRLSDDERKAVDYMLAELNNPAATNKNVVFEKFGKLIAKADSYDPLPHDSDVIEYQYHMFDSVWPDVRDLRDSGDLLALGKQIKCPVVAIHGDHDPHPAKGIRQSLSNMLTDFRFVLLNQCGHYPWYEKQVKNRFYSILRQELER